MSPEPGRDLLESLKDFKEWQGSDAGFDLLDYVQCVGTPDLFFAFGELFAPKLVQHQGFYFIASHFDVALYDQWMQKLGDPVAVQKALNHIHISSLFQQQEITDRVAIEAAKRLAGIWSLVLESKGLIATHDGSTLHDAEVTFYNNPVKSMTRLAARWMNIANVLSVQVVSPASVLLPSGRRIEAEVLLLKFGGPNGMLLATREEAIGTASEELVEAGYGYSVVGEPDPAEAVDFVQDDVIDMLRDWGWSGNDESMPAWLRNR